MKLRHIAQFWLWLFLFTYAAFLNAADTKPPSIALLLNIDGAIGPAIADYVTRGIDVAQTEGASAVILQMDTPGGLDKSMRQIIKKIRSSTIPVITYVAPSGARAASAGTYILYASHIAAMAPGTNLGAATPVSIGGDGLPLGEPPKPNDKPLTPKDKTNEQQQSKPPLQHAMKQKVTNDAVAYIRSLADLHGRNADWAEKAVREAASLSAQVALKQNVIDVIAADIPSLLKKINNRKIIVNQQSIIFKIPRWQIKPYHPDWRVKLLAVITDPSIAYILLLLGIYGLFFEFTNPGFVVPGVVGAISLLLALFALQLLPINFAGLALMILGIIFMVAEAFVPSFGALGIGGIIAFVIGSILLLDTELPGYQIAWPLIFAMAAVNALFFFFIVGIAIKAHRKQVVTGLAATLYGATAVVVNDFEQEGQVRIKGEIWRARSAEPLKAGEVVSITAHEGLILIVEKVK